MPGSLTRLKYHVVFATKDRYAYLEPEIEARLHPYIGGIVASLDGVSEAINGMPDHLHLLISLKATHTLADVVQRVKGGSSKWLNESGLCGETFGWQNGYAAFTVSESQAPRVCRYIERQKEHHRNRSFAEEMTVLLENHGLSVPARDGR